MKPKSSQRLDDSSRRPRIEKFSNCTMEFDYNRGVIVVIHNGRVKLRVSRVMLSEMVRPTVGVFAAEYSRVKVIKWT